ncbi:MAG: hypothetical protein HZB31_02485 [Nitrospirae bacterium]|nr:hypothetical protein [Nitrospirota bacterium]
MGYSIALLGDKEGFDKRLLFHSSLDETEIRSRFDAFKATCSGVAREHLPFRCPVKKVEGEGVFELVLDERNLSYNFDTLMQFLAELVTAGKIKAAKVMDGGRFGASAYVVTPGISMKFDFFPANDMMTRIQNGQLAFMDAMKNSSGITVRQYLEKLND